MTNAALLTDFYKHSHARQYPVGTQFVYSNTTPRSSRMQGVNSVVVFGTQYLIDKYLIEVWNDSFFNKPKEEAVSSMQSVLSPAIGPDSVDYAIFEELHDLGHLPLEIKALPEGTSCPIGVPFMTVVNTDPRFYWVTNFIETLTQTVLWQAITSATIAREYKKILVAYAEKTSDATGFVPFQAHDFSMRGMSSIETASVSGAAHLTSFCGTDTIPAIPFLNKYYKALNSDSIIGCSVPATEHAVMCAGGAENETETYRRLIEDIYPSGIVSIVSDTWDFWHVMNVTLPSLKEKIFAREGKVVVRPDSGDPYRICVGYFVKETNDESADVLECLRKTHKESRYFTDNDCVLTSDGKYITVFGEEITEQEAEGAIACLYRNFGGSINTKGYIELDPHVGLIYGDSITLDRCNKILNGLERKGFASTNMVFGVGSYTYQYNTRDTFSIACKATNVVINGESREIFKSPKTDSGTKKSARGLLRVDMNDLGEITLFEGQTPEQESGGLLKTVFLNGRSFSNESIDSVRGRLSGEETK